MKISALPQEINALCRPVCLLVQQVTVGNNLCLCCSLCEHRIRGEVQCSQGDEFTDFQFSGSSTV